MKNLGQNWAHGARDKTPVKMAEGEGAEEGK